MNSYAFCNSISRSFDPFVGFNRRRSDLVVRKRAAPGWVVGRSSASPSSANGRRRSAAQVVRYADEVYDALHQWEDGEVAAMHERLRREAALADDMFDREGDGRGAGSGRAKSKAKPRAKAARR